MLGYHKCVLNVCVSNLLKTFLHHQILNDESSPVDKPHSWQNCSLSVWTNQQVCDWLMAMNMEQYIVEFTAKGINGKRLLELDSSNLKVWIIIR